MVNTEAAQAATKLLATQILVNYIIKRGIVLIYS
jgi:hypothetical protein